MRREDRFLFLATRQMVTSEQRESMLELTSDKSFSWNLVLWTSEKNGVAPLVYRNIVKQPGLVRLVPEEVLAQFRLSIARYSFLKTKRGKHLEKALDYFHEKSIRVLLMKGAAFDWLVYEQPWYTVSKDIDIILSAHRDELSQTEMLELVNFLHNSGIEFDFYEHHDVNMNGVLPVNFDLLWQDAQIMDYRGHEILVLSPEDMLISACINCCRKRFFYLKSLCDIAETIKKYEDLDWAKFSQRAVDFECNNIVYVSLLVTQKTLGCEFPGIVLQQLHINPFRSILIRAAIAQVLRLVSFSGGFPFFSKIELFGRQLDLALILTYSSYSIKQIRQKYRQIRQLLAS